MIRFCRRVSVDTTRHRNGRDLRNGSRDLVTESRTTRRMHAMGFKCIETVVPIVFAIDFYGLEHGEAHNLQPALEKFGNLCIGPGIGDDVCHDIVSVEIVEWDHTSPTRRTTATRARGQGRGRVG